MAARLLLDNITCVCLYLLALVSFSNPAKRNLTANNWFGVAMFSAGCMLLNALIYELRAQTQYSKLILFNELSRFIVAPALYLSILYFTSPGKKFNKHYYLHFIPFVLFFLLMLAWTAGRLSFALPDAVSRMLANFVSVFAKAQLLVYWLMSWYQLKRHQQNIRLINSSTEGVDLLWLRNLLYGIALMLVAWVAGSLLKAPWLQLLVSVAYLAGLLVTGYFLLAQKEVYPFEQPQLQDIADVIDSSAKPFKQRLTDKRSTDLKSRLTDIMLTKKIYLDNELSLPALADELNVSTHDLSYFCNEVLGSSFFKLINRYRVEEAKQLMLSAQHRHLNLLGIAYAAGFNSKTTFNTAFKTETGMSPTQFIQQNKNLIQSPLAGNIVL